MNSNETIHNAIRAHKGLLIAGRTGSGKVSVLASLVTESNPDEPRFVFTGELFINKQACTMFQEIAGKGIPVSATIQAESEKEAWDRISTLAGIPIETVKTMFPVVVLVGTDTLVAQQG